MSQIGLECELLLCYVQCIYAMSVIVVWMINSKFSLQMCFVLMMDSSAVPMGQLCYVSVLWFVMYYTSPVRSTIARGSCFFTSWGNFDVGIVFLPHILKQFWWWVWCASGPVVFRWNCLMGCHVNTSPIKQLCKGFFLLTSWSNSDGGICFSLSSWSNSDDGSVLLFW